MNSAGKMIMLAALTGILSSCAKELSLEIFETSRAGNKLAPVTTAPSGSATVVIEINPAEKHQTISGIGGSFTEATSYLLMQLSETRRAEVLNAYFGESGARYSLTRTHINSSDFSRGNYAYAPVAGDMELKQFSIQEDMDDIIPVMKQAQALSKDGFKIVASPWTAPPWMKDNKAWKGGKLLPEFYPVWALYFSRYIAAYAEQGLPIWAVTVENEPLGNDSNWESMHYSPQEMNLFVKEHLGPRLKADGHKVKIFGYDQNRDDHLPVWADAMYDDPSVAQWFDGMAVHWYAGTVDVFPELLKYAKDKAPEKHLIQSEACIDAEVPHWNDDDWYWRPEATDWGIDWAPPEKKHLHPKYEPVYRYARDIIGTLNNGVDGWIDWNMVLDKQGGPNWAKNWCIAPVIADISTDSVYYTPLYYVMTHFSRFIRPGSVRIGNTSSDGALQVTAVQNPDGSIVAVVFNPTENPVHYNIKMNGGVKSQLISAQAIQSIIIHQ